MNYFVADNVDQAYREMGFAVLSRGKRVTARGMLTKELTDVRLDVAHPRDRVTWSRRPDLRYLVGELCWYLDGRRDLDSIAHYSKFWNKVSDDDVSVNSCYGRRLFTCDRFGKHVFGKFIRSQLDYAVDCLVSDVNTRKAVMAIYNPFDMYESRDNPCTLTLQFLIRDEKLDLYVSMRSQDAWLGFAYDVAFFTLVQEIALMKLIDQLPGLCMGPYHHAVTSFHVYERHFDDVRGSLVEPISGSLLMPQLVTDDVTGWFNDLLTYEKSKRGIEALYESESRRTRFQDWCKSCLG